MQQGNVTRDQVLQFVRDNGVKVSEKMLGSLSDLEQSRAEAHLSSVRAQRNELRNEIWGSPDELAHVGILHEISDPATRANVGGWAHDATSPTVTPGVKRVALRKLEALPLTPEQLAKVLKWGELAHASDAAERATLGPEAGSPKYSNWQLPGGQNYKELLLTLPSATDRITDAEAERAGMGPHAGYETDAFVSSHFKGVSNILAHVRFNERTDADGKRVLFLEEIQSDWAQKGRAAGFRGPGESVTPFGYPNEFRITQSEHQYHVDSPNGDYHVDIGKGTVESEAAAREYANRYFKQLWEARVRAGRDKVAPAPFVTKTEAWVALALKRMIRYAADNGFDRVAWTNGDQQAARYSLEKHLEEIQTSRRADGLYEVHASDKHGRSVFGSAGYVNVNAQNLEHYVGKEMAQKIIDETPPEGKGAKKWRGLDLKVGGSGMREFYDKILPNIAGDVLKKIGGGKVDESGMVLDTKRGTGQEYVGPTMNEGELDAMIADHSINATMRAQLQDVRARLVMGATFHQAINEEGSIALAEMIGGRMKGVGAPETRQSGFDITPKMVERAQQGMALFEPQPGYGDYPGAPGREISSEQYLKAADQREAEATKSAESATGTAIACALANGVGYA
jgi:hypothetical protein